MALRLSACASCEVGLGCQRGGLWRFVVPACPTRFGPRGRCGVLRGCCLCSFSVWLVFVFPILAWFLPWGVSPADSPLFSLAAPTAVAPGSGGCLAVGSCFRRFPLRLVGSYWRSVPLSVFWLAGSSVDWCLPALEGGWVLRLWRRLAAASLIGCVFCVLLHYRWWDLT